MRPGNGTGNNRECEEISRAGRVGPSERCGNGKALLISDSEIATHVHLCYDNRRIAGI